VKFKSQVYTEASGSIGGITYSHNKGGLYTRARTIPTNPGSSYQQTIRGYVQELTNKWVTVLSSAERDAWAVYADAVLIPDSLGEPRKIPPLAHFIRCLVARYAYEMRPATTTYNAPVIFDLGGDWAPPVLSIAAATDIASVAFQTGDAWVTENGACIAAAFSRPQNASINYFKGPYRYAGRTAGNAGAPPASPATFNLPFKCVAGQKIFGLIRVSRADYRLTLPFQGVGVAA
jgi:hypothetical protein